MKPNAVMVQGIAAMLTLVGIALFARRLGPDGYGWFGVATAVAAIFLSPLLHSITATITRGADSADAPHPTSTIARVLLAVIAMLLLIAAVWRVLGDPGPAEHIYIPAVVLAALLISTSAWRDAWRPRLMAGDLSTMRARIPSIALTAFGAALLHWVDRLFLVGHVSQSNLGIYAAASDVSQQFFVPLTSLLYIAWLPRLMSARAVATAQERARIEMRYALAVMTLLLPALTAFILVRMELVDAVFGAAYAAQASLLPWIALAVVLGAVRGTVLDAGLYREGRTRSVLHTVAISALVNVTLNALYVPRYGVMAAVATGLVSQSLAFFLAWRASRDIIAWRIPRVQFERIVFCSTAMAFVVLLLPGEFAFAARVGIAAVVYAGALLLVNGAGFRDWLGTRLRRMD